MFKFMQSNQFSFPESFSKKRQSNIAMSWIPLILLLELGLAILAVYLVISDYWLIGICFFIALPALILLHKYPWLVLLIWLIAVPFLTLTPTTAERQIYWVIHRALPPLGVIIIMLTSILHIYEYKLPKLGLSELAIAAYVIVSVLSIFLFDNAPLSKSFIFYDRVISPICLYLIIRWRPLSEKELKYVEPVIVFLLLSQSVIGILSWFAPSLLPPAWLGYAGERATGTLRSYGAYAATMIFSGLFLLQSALKRKAGLIRIFYICAFALALFGVFISFSRAAWVAGGLVILGLCFLRPKFMIGFVLFFTPLVILLLATGSLTGLTNWAEMRLYSEESQQSALSRLPVYQASIQMLVSKPFLGWGYENFNQFDWQFYGRVGNYVNADKNLSSHNFYLTLLAEQGLIGFFLFMFPFFLWFKRSFKALLKLSSGENWNQPLLAILWLFILGYIVINSFQSMRIVFCLGLWWISLALIANIVESRIKMDELKRSNLNVMRRHSISGRVGVNEAIR